MPFIVLVREATVSHRFLLPTSLHSFDTIISHLLFDFHHKESVPIPTPNFLKKIILKANKKCSGLFVNTHLTIRFVQYFAIKCYENCPNNTQNW